MESLNDYIDDCKSNGVDISSIDMKSYFPEDIFDDSFIDIRTKKDESFYENYIQKIEIVKDELKRLSEFSVTNIIAEISRLLYIAIYVFYSFYLL